MPRRAARKDANHGTIAEALRAIGAEVFDTSQIPGLLDCIVGYRGRLIWFEIKDGRKAPSERRLTPAEQATLARLERVQAPAYVVTSAGDAIAILEAL